MSRRSRARGFVPGLLTAVAALAAGAPVAGAAPGDLVKSAPLTLEAGGPVVGGTKAWKVTFKSTTALGKAVTETGTVLVPTAAWTGKGPRPLVGLAPGTQGMADRCAASAQLAAGTQYESANIIKLVAKGWAVALPDYEGLGTPGVHAYAVGRSLGPSLLDVMRAARSLTAAKLSKTGPVAIMGYSEGGGSAGWAAQLQATYAPDLKLRAAAVGGVIADPVAIATGLDGTMWAFLLGYAQLGFQAAYPDVRLEGKLNATGKAGIKALGDSCVGDALAQFGPFTISQFSDDPKILATPSLVRRETENTLGATAPRAPVTLFHVKADDILPYTQATALKRRWCARGANVRFVTVPGATHAAGAFKYNDGAIAFLAKGFAGRAPARPTTCPG